MSNWMLMPLADISLKSTIEMMFEQDRLGWFYSFVSGAHEGEEEVEIYCFT
jgi:hypothetical protein